MWINGRDPGFAAPLKDLVQYSLGRETHLLALRQRPQPEGMIPAKGPFHDKP